ncbi:MAG TPA: transposase [Thermaerobacter sp.]
MLPAEHPLLDIDRAVDFAFVEEETADRYSADQGRPSYPPKQLVRVLFLAVWANLSDVQVCQQLRYNVLYRYVCRIGWEDPIPDDTTLVRQAVARPRAEPLPGTGTDGDSGAADLPGAQRQEDGPSIQKRAWTREGDSGHRAGGRLKGIDPHGSPDPPQEPPPRNATSCIQRMVILFDRIG